MPDIYTLPLYVASMFVAQWKGGRDGLGIFRHI